MTKVKKIDNPKVCKGVETLELPSAAGGDETIWEIVWQFLKNLNLHTPHHSFSKYLSKRNEDICPYKDLHMFIIALLVLAKTNTQQQFGLTNWRYGHMMEYYAAAKRMTDWHVLNMDDFKIIMLSERSQIIKSTNWWFHLYKTLEKANKSMISKSRSKCAWWEGWGRGKGGITNGPEQTFGDDGYCSITWLH